MSKIDVEKALSIRQKSKGTSGQKGKHKIVEDGKTALSARRSKAAGILVQRNIAQVVELVFNRSRSTLPALTLYDLLSVPDDTPVMGQCRGTMHSDFFQFTVGQYRAYAKAAFAPLKSPTVEHCEMGFG